jgi:hypothetical protein
VRALSNLITRLSVREQRMLLLLGAVLLALAAQAALSWSSAQRDLYLTAAADLGLADFDRQSSARNSLDAFDRAQLDALSRWSVRGRDIWFVRLDIERHIRASAQEAGLNNPDVQVAEAVESGSALQLLRADVSGPYQGAAMVRFLRRLTDDPKVAFVDRLQVQRGQDPRYRISLLFPVEFGKEGSS